MTIENEDAKEVVTPELNQYGRELDPLFYLNALSRHVEDWRVNRDKIPLETSTNEVLNRVFKVD
ncbi:MAG: hypothetical protein M3Q79_00130 [bacterium]|nr:hypothetical protein [bacterium]